MSGSVLLDTSVIVPHLRKHSVRIKKPSHGGSLYVIPIILGELYYGAYYSDNPDQKITAIQAMRGALDELSIDEATVLEYGKTRARLRKQGTPLPENDVWIAAAAIRYGLPVATYDKHFTMVPGLKTSLWKM